MLRIPRRGAVKELQELRGAVARLQGLIDAVEGDEVNETEAWGLSSATEDVGSCGRDLLSEACHREYVRKYGEPGTQTQRAKIAKPT